MDTDLLLIITSTAVNIYGGTNVDEFERLWNTKEWAFSELFSFIFQE